MELQKIRLLKQVLNDPNPHIQALTKFQNTYEGLQIGSYSIEVLLDTIENGISNVSSRFKDIATKQLEKSQISSPLLKANLLKGCEEVLEEFVMSIENLCKSAIEFNKKAEFDKITKTQMQIIFMGISGYSDSFSNDQIKWLCVGINASLVTKCGKDYKFNYSRIEVLPGDETWHIYARVPRNGGTAELMVFTHPMPNDEEYFYIHWQSGTFDKIKF